MHQRLHHQLQKLWPLLFWKVCIQIVLYITLMFFKNHLPASDQHSAMDQHQLDQHLLVLWSVLPEIFSWKTRMLSQNNTKNTRQKASKHGKNTSFQPNFCQKTLNFPEKWPSLPFLLHFYALIFFKVAKKWQFFFKTCDRKIFYLKTQFLGGKFWWDFLSEKFWL